MHYLRPVFFQLTAEYCFKCLTLLRATLGGGANINPILQLRKLGNKGKEKNPLKAVSPRSRTVTMLNKGSLYPEPTLLSAILILIPRKHT